MPGDRIDPLGWEELLGSTGLVLLEWADRAGDLQPEDRWSVRIDYGANPDERVVRAARLGEAQALVDW
jgi:tRNA A37 threonylcarbamoyladenosine biosynthesis protein TsaE